jgi:predicted permease
MGSTALAHDQAHDVWVPHWLQGLGQDLRLAVRTLRATPVIALVAILSLALGIGANTAIFSLVDSLLLRDLPVQHPERLVLLRDSVLTNSDTWDYHLWEQIQQRPWLFDGALAYSSTRFDLSAGGPTEYVDGVWTSGSFFHVLGVPAVLGRPLTEADDQPGGGPDGPVAMISDRFWQERYNGAADAIGRTLTLDKVAFTIVGVTPPDFFGLDVGRTFDVAAPINDEPLIDRRGALVDKPSGIGGEFTVIGRLRPEQSVESATAALRGVQAQIRQATLPKNWPPKFLDAYLRNPFGLAPAATGRSFLRRRFTRPLLAIMAIVALVLFIACVNLANLLLARGTARRQELSVRRALGASRWRLVRQLFAESAVLAGAGAAFGVLLASWFSHLLIRQLSTSAPAHAGPSVTTGTVFLDLSLDKRVLAFTIALTAATTLLFGLLPALRASRAAPMDALKGSEGAGARSRRVGGPAGILIVVQVALSLVLVVAAGLFIRTVKALDGRDLGFDGTRILSVSIDSGRTAIEPARRVAVYEQAVEAVRVLPGVADAALSALPPIQNSGLLMQPIKAISGEPSLPGPNRNGTTSSASFLNLISPGWFRTMGIPIVAGRDVRETDRLKTPPIAIVNQAFVHRLLRGDNPIGRLVTLYLPGPPPPPIEIVGVAADSVYGSARDTPHPTMYLPMAQRDAVWWPFLAAVDLNVRSAGPPPASLIKSVAAAVGRVSPELALTFHPLSDQIGDSLVQERLVAMVSGVFAVLALLLAALGLYGVVSYSVTRRRREIKIRMALGASPGSVVRLVIARIAGLVAMGMIAGAGLSLWAGRFVASLLYGLEPRDPITLGGAAVVLAAAAAAAGWLPARRAARIDPAGVLRCE